MAGFLESAFCGCLASMYHQRTQGAGDSFSVPARKSVSTLTLALKDELNRIFIGFTFQFPAFSGRAYVRVVPTLVKFTEN